MRLPGLVVALCLALAQGGLAEEISASQVSKVSHAEGYTVITASYNVSEAIVWQKGKPKQSFLLIVQHQKKPQRYFTIAEPGRGIQVGEGKGVKYTVDFNRKVLTIESGGKKVEEKFKDVIDS